VRRLTALVLAAAAVAGCSGDEGPGGAEAARPETFVLSVGSGLASTVEVSWNGEALVYASYDPRTQRRTRAVVRPSEEAWLRFWREADRLGVWSWRARYRPRLIVPDATAWEVRMARGGQRVESRGAAAFPAPGGGSTEDAEPVFARFSAAVSRLAGGRPFLS
jgi:hypothetical protein